MTSSVFPSSRARTVAITGATGQIGAALVERLRADGTVVRRLVRGSPASAEDRQWNPAQGILDPAALDGVDAVVHLAGEPIARRWTAERKGVIRESRVRSTELLARTLARMAHPPAVLLSGSAVGYYGDRGDSTLDERSEMGTGFLAQLCGDWERATSPAQDAGMRVAHLRTGVVLSSSGGALEQMLPSFRLGLGGPLASGRQWTSWIALDDQTKAIAFALDNDAIRGPVNLCSPAPVTNAELTATLGRVLARPAILRVPRVALELLFGEMADEVLLASQRVLPRGLLGAGFQFGCPTLEQALRRAVGR